MKFILQLQPQDMIDAQRLHMRPRLFFRIMIYGLMAIYGILIVSAVYSLFTQGEWMDGATFPLGLGIYVALLFYVFMPWNARRVFKQQKTLHDPFTMELTEEGLFVDSTRGTLRMAWKDFHKWKINQKLILIYHSERMYNLIPARAFTNDAERQTVLTLIESHLGKPRT